MPLSIESDPFLTANEIESKTKGVLKAATLNFWRSTGKYKSELPFEKIGRLVYYRESVIEAFLRGVVSAQSTSEITSGQS